MLRSGGTTADLLRCNLLLRLVLAGLAAGMALSTKLWLAERAYPLAPVVSLSDPVVAGAHYVLLVLLALGVAALLLRPNRIALYLMLITLGLLCLLDQSRLQPWVLQYAAIALLAGLAVTTAKSLPDLTSAALRCSGLVFAATYFWSGVQKLNPWFRDDVFPWFTEPLAGWLGVEQLPYLLGYVCPWTEIAIALGLLLPATRRPAVVGVLGIHAFALLMLGPIGHNWNAVVWPWNVVQALAVVQICWRDKSRWLPTLPQRLAPAYAGALAAFVLLPGLSFLGWWDSYPSLALYSGNVSEGFVTLPESSYAALPAAVRGEFAQQGEGWRANLHRWSLAELGVPAYPEPRVFIAVARELARRNGPGSVALEIDTRPTLLQGKQHIRCDERLLARRPGS